MRVVYANNQSQIINVGRQGENLATAVYFDLSELIAVFGEGTFAIVHKRAGDATPYPVTHTERIEDSAVWTLDATDTAHAGIGRVELRWYVDEVLAKTVVYAIAIQSSLGVTGDVPDPYEDIIDTIAGYAHDAEDAMDAAQGYAGTASQSAIDAAASERAAGASETAAANSERAASGYALTASQKADAASGSAQTASDKASAAQGYAQTASGKASEAQGYAQTASDKADAAAASAQTASDKADAAADSAADAEAAAASIVVDSALSRTSEHPVQNKVITLALDDKASAIVESASGNLVAIADGADGMPMVSVLASIEPKQSGTGDPSPDNVRPISGWDSVNVTRCGKNLLNLSEFETTTKNGITFEKQTDGGIYVHGTASSNARVGVVISYTALAGETYTFGKWKNAGSIGSNSFNVAILGDATRIAWEGNQYVTFTPSTNQSYTEFAFFVASGTTVNNTFYPQLEVGSTASDFEPYVGQTYPTTLPQTVYGGTLDVVSGVLTITHGIKTGGFTRGSVDSSGKLYNCGSITDALSAEATDVFSGATNYFKSDYSLDSLRALPSGYGLTMYNKTIFIRGYVGDESALDALLPTLQVCYPLATPQTIQLTATEVDSLLADNNVWADSGDVSVIYRADTKLYIDGKQIDIRSTIAPIEDGEKASQAYAIGKYFYHNGSLCKAKTAIASGATFTLGTNYTVTTVADELYLLNS